MSPDPRRDDSIPARDSEQIGIDDAELERLGYTPQLKREMSVWSVFALGFATISPVVGLFSVLALSFILTGPAWVWAVVIAFAGQLLVAVVYAELASQFPIVGGVYQWVRLLVGPRAGWLTGLLYLAAAIASLTTVAYLGGTWVWLLVTGENPDPVVHVLCAAGFSVVAVLVNLFGVRGLKVFLNAGIAAEAVASIGIGLLLLLAFRTNSFGILFESLGAGGSETVTAAGFTMALAVAGWAFLGFDATTQMSEETREPRRSVPRALLRSFLFVGFTVLLTAFAVTLSLKDPSRAVNGVVFDPVVTAVTEAFGPWSEKPFVVIVLIAFLACAVSIQTYVGRAIFAVAREGQLPFSRALTRVNRHQVPWIALIVTGVLGAVGLLLGLNGDAVGTLITFGSGGFYIVFLIVAVTALVARLTGRWKPAAGAFRLGALGLAINILAVLWLAFEAVNVAWPRAEFAAPGAPVITVWAVVIVFSALMVVGLVYLLVAKPHRALPLTSTPAGPPASAPTTIKEQG
ncbi:APC family permease [Herbiconiux sp. YIM B11900]|uniref:APC family permease n=1 Tax=Herbiconiux sp. YIM B11900 TaxID=3404131 RepID=UPI003F851C71